MSMVTLHPRLGINTYSYIWITGLDQCLHRLGSLGYQVFEAVIHPPHLALDDSYAQRRRVVSALTGQNLTLRSLNLPSLDHNLASPLKPMRDFSIALFRQAIDLAAELAVPYLVTVPGRMSPLLPPDLAQRRRWLQDSLDTLLPYAEQRGVNLALENVPFAAFPDAQTLGHFVRGFQGAPISVCYDIANAHYIGESPGWGLRELAGLVSLVHLSDTTSRCWRHDEVGLGDVPFAQVPPALQDIGFTGACLLEIIATEPEAAIARSHQRLESLGF